ncbi:hypothetical protein KKF84_16860 [Myxococcota bacterium]|nr:hypothetical protein [Myxococcota bacterium]
MEKYVKATRTIWDQENSEYNTTFKWIAKFTDAKKDEYNKGISKKLDAYKVLIEKLEKVEAPNSALEKIKKLDVDSLKARRDIIKLWRDKLKEGKQPKFDTEFTALSGKYSNLLKERNRLTQEYYKKYSKSKSRRGKKSKKWKKKKKKR